MFTTYLPIRWCGHVPVNDFGHIVLLFVEFYSDFGPFLCGETVPELHVDFVEGWMYEPARDRRCEFLAVLNRREKTREDSQ